MVPARLCQPVVKFDRRLHFREQAAARTLAPAFPTLWGKIMASDDNTKIDDIDVSGTLDAYRTR